MARPLIVDGTSGLIEMTDTQLELLSFYLRIAYASQLSNGGNGSLNVGGSGVTIGSAVDSTSKARTDSEIGDGVGGSDPPPAPPLDSEQVTSYTYKQIRTFPTFPTNATLDADGFLVIDGTSGIKVVSTEAQIYANVLSHCISQMRTGDEIGTYKIATSQPSSDWTDKGVWFTDTTYSAGTTTYKLWLRTAGTAPSGSLPLVLDGSSGIKQHALSASANMIVNVLLPSLTRRMQNGDLLYSILTNATGNRGAFYNTYQQSSTVTNTEQYTSFWTYFTTSTPSGAATNINTYSLNLA